MTSNKTKELMKSQKCAEAQDKRMPQQDLEILECIFIKEKRNRAKNKQNTNFSYNYVSFDATDICKNYQQKEIISNGTDF